MGRQTFGWLRRCVMALVVFGSAELADGMIIDYSTTIDYPVRESIYVREGQNPPTVVDFVDGASITTWLLGVLSAEDSSIVNVRGGEIQDFLKVYDQSTVNMSGGWVGSETYVENGGTLNLSGGQAGFYLYVRHFGTLTFSGGRVGEGLDAFDSSTVDISGDAWAGESYLAAHGSSRVTLRGGTVPCVWAYDSSVLNISGGSIGNSHGELGAFDSSTMNIYGYDLLLTEDSGPSYDFTLTGTLADGNPIDVGVVWRDDAQIILHQIPEPSGLVLLLTALAALLAWIIHSRSRAAFQPARRKDTQDACATANVCE